MSDSISALVNDLPNRSITVYVLESLDFVVPGEWTNVTDFEEMVKEVTGETDPSLIQAVIKRADALYADPDERYQQAMRFYNIADRTDKALAAAAFADKIGNRIGFLSFLSRLTPKADTAQTIDFSLKLIIELLAFCAINGIPGDSIGDFVESLADYSKESLMRMSALISLDGLVPLGADLTRIAVNTIENLTPDELEDSSTFQQLKEWIPGGDSVGQLQFINKSLGSVKDWMDGFIDARNLSPDSISANVQKYIDITDDKLDYLGAFLDLMTNYYSHTGTQTIARRIIERAINEI